MPAAPRDRDAANDMNMQIKPATPYREQVVSLLASQKLPYDDLPADLDNFIVASHGKEIIAVAGVEIYGACGLLRSVAVNPDYRNQGIAGKLVVGISEIAANNGVNQLWLLTETASDYFARKGFEQIARANVPAEVQQSSEFAHVCPQSAIAMKREIPFNDNKE